MTHRVIADRYYAMSISQLREKYNQLTHDLSHLEKKIISLRGELKWGPSDHSSLFYDYDGAIDKREHLEEELYELQQRIKQQADLNEDSGEPNKVIPFPTLYLNRKMVGTIN